MFSKIHLKIIVIKYDTTYINQMLAIHSIYIAYYVVVIDCMYCVIFNCDYSKFVR